MTRSKQGSRGLFWRRNASRINRFHRFLTTALPTLRDIDSPNRQCARPLGFEWMTKTPSAITRPDLNARSKSRCLTTRLDFGNFSAGSTGINGGARSIHDLGVGDEFEELLVALKATELFDQLFHRIDRIHRVERSADHGHGMVGLRIVKEFFTACARL